MLTPAQIEQRLEEIEADMAERQPKFEQAAEDFHRLTRDFNLRYAHAFMAAKGSTATERKQIATVAVAASDDGVYAKLLDAEGRYEGLRAALNTMDKRGMIGMALLKSHGRA